MTYYQMQMILLIFLKVEFTPKETKSNVSWEISQLGLTILIRLFKRWVMHYIQIFNIIFNVYGIFLYWLKHLWVLTNFSKPHTVNWTVTKAQRSRKSDFLQYFVNRHYTQYLYKKVLYIATSSFLSKLSLK